MSQGILTGELQLSAGPVPRRKHGQRVVVKVHWIKPVMSIAWCPDTVAQRP
jgi:hypothetical protein